MMIANWNAYYTPKEVAKKIIDIVPREYNPILVVDICVGSGNFIEAALRKWENAEAVGVDVNNIENNKINTYTLNALEFENLNFINKNIKKLVVANPPFGKAIERIKSYSESHKQLQAYALKSKRIEANMLVSNITILNDGDILAAVLPENIFSSDKLADFRDLFLSYFDVLHIGESSKFFLGSEVMTRIFVGKYHQHNNIFLENKKQKSNSKFQINRGIDNSLISKLPYSANLFNSVEVIHFSNFANIKATKFVEDKNYPSHFYLNKNDLLISRVGRNAGKVLKVNKAMCGKIFSDYFFVVKNLRLKKQSIEELENELLKFKKGLTTKYLSKSDISKVISNFEKGLRNQDISNNIT